MPSVRLLWKQWIGIGTWKTEPIDIGDSIVFPVAGNAWNTSDIEDGVVCLDSTTGEVRWRSSTDSDANAAVYDGGTIYVGTDSGSVYAISAQTGSIKWVRRLQSSVLARPLVTAAGVFVCTVGASVDCLYQLHRDTGAIIGVKSLPTGAVADPITAGGRICVVTRHAHLLALPLETTRLTESSGAWLQLDQYTGADSLNLEVHGSPTVWGSRMIIPLVNNTWFSAIPIGVVDVGEQLSVTQWPYYDSCVSFDQFRFGNARIRPVIAGQTLVMPLSAGNLIVGTDLRTRMWEHNCGSIMDEQRASPAVYRDMVLVPRSDGFLHAVEARSGRRCWSILPSDPTFNMHTSPAAPQRDEYQYHTEHPSLHSTPLVRGNVVFVLDSVGFAFALLFE